MFQPDRMMHVEILVSQNILLPVAEYLGQRGILHLTHSSRHVDAEPGAIREDAKVLAAWRALADRVGKLMAFLDLTPPRTRPLGREPSRVSRDTGAVDAPLVRLEREAEDIEAALALLTEECERLHTLRDQIEPLAGLDADITMFSEFRHMASRLGTVPTEILPRLRKGLASYNAIIVPVRTLGKATVILAFAAAAHEVVLGYALRSAFFKPIAIPERLKGSPGHILATIDEIMTENDEGIASLMEERQELAERRRDRILELWYLAEDNRRTFEMVDLFLRTREAYLVTGWIPATDVEGLERDVNDLTSGRGLVTATPPRPDETQVPTRLVNPLPFSVFEPITATYGVPAYDEFDPTPLVAVSSLIMFGAMFGDVGHGLLLALLGLGAHLVAARTGSSLVRFTPLLIAAGLASAVFGVLFGSVFGREGFIHPLWLTPADEIMHLFFVACTFGAGLVMIGLALNVVSRALRGDWGRALLDKFGLAGVLFYGAFLWTAVSVASGGAAAVSSLKIALLVLPLGLIAGRVPLCRLLHLEVGHEGGGLFAHVVEAIVEVFETIMTFFSNTLSFVRLAAFAVSHAGLSQTVYVLAEDVAGGGAVGWAVIVGGNLFIVLFEGLIVGIQTMRLEYYEFFSKFFRSGGVPYRPFALERRGARSRS